MEIHSHTTAHLISDNFLTLRKMHVKAVQRVCWVLDASDKLACICIVSVFLGGSQIAWSHLPFHRAFSSLFCYELLHMQIHTGLCLQSHLYRCVDACKSVRSTWWGYAKVKKSLTLATCPWHPPHSRVYLTLIVFHAGIPTGDWLIQKAYSCRVKKRVKEVRISR